MSDDAIPLIFVRIRNLTQFKHFGNGLTKKQARALCGVNFPKFNAENGYEYFGFLQDLNERLNEILYGMPIIEDSKVAYKENRMPELIRIRKILDKYRKTRLRYLSRIFLISIVIWFYRYVLGVRIFRLYSVLEEVWIILSMIS